MADYAQVILVRGPEYIARVAPETLPGELHKPVLRDGNDVLHRNAGIINAILSAHQVPCNQRTVYPRQHVVVQRIYLAEGRAHLSRPGHKTFRQRREGNKTFFQVHALLAKRDEEISRRIWIDNGLQAYLRFMHFE